MRVRCAWRKMGMRKVFLSFPPIILEVVVVLASRASASSAIKSKGRLKTVVGHSRQTFIDSQISRLSLDTHHAMEKATLLLPFVLLLLFFVPSLMLCLLLECVINRWYGSNHYFIGIKHIRGELLNCQRKKSRHTIHQLILVCTI